VSNWGYWEFNGRNGLVGKASTTEELPDGRVITIKDPDLPAVLEDNDILHCLQRSRQARHDFDRLFPGLDAESQARLTTLIESNPRVSSLIESPQDWHDAVQREDVVSSTRGA
jgi:hypothetical protein